MNKTASFKKTPRIPVTVVAQNTYKNACDLTCTGVRASYGTIMQESPRTGSATVSPICFNNAGKYFIC